MELSNPPRPSGGRASRLFIRGTEVLLGQDDMGDVLIWVQALTSTQKEEASLAAAMAGTRKRLTLVPGNEEYDLLKLQMDTEATDSDLVDGIIAAKHDRLIWVDAELDLHADPSWREGGRLDLIRMGDAQLASGAEMTNEEATAVAALNEAYMIDWRRYANARLAAKRAELTEKTRPELEQEFVEAAVSLQTLGIQAREYNFIAVFYAMRQCSATLADGTYNHLQCSHQQYYHEISDVRTAPDELIEATVAALSDLDSAADVLGG